MVRLLRLVGLEVPIAVRGVLLRAALRLMGGRAGPGLRAYGGARIVVGGPGATIEIGRRFRILRGAVVNTLPPRGRVRIGDDVHLGEASMVTAGELVEIGDDVVIGPQTILVDTDHRWDDPARPIRVQGLRAEPIRIGAGAWLGAHVTVLGGVTVGEGAIVGAGAVVTRDVAPGSIVAGVPARVIGRRPGRPAE